MVFSIKVTGPQEIPLPRVELGRGRDIGFSGAGLPTTKFPKCETLDRRQWILPATENDIDKR